jgi:hypothetical protein
MHVLARSALVVGAASVLTLGGAPIARAQSAADRATARELGKDGQAALDIKDYATAEDRFRRADALFHAPTLLLGFARAEAGLGKVVNASEAYNRIVREGVAPGAPEAFVNAVEAAKAEVGPVDARIANVVVVVSGPDNPVVTLDDQPLPVAALGVKRPVDPGEHVVKATADGWDPATTTFLVTDAGSASATLTMNRSAAAPVALSPVAPAPAVSLAPPPPPSDHGPSSAHGNAQVVAGWVGIVVGGVGLATGAVAGIVAIGAHSTLETKCATRCTEGEINAYHTVGAVSTAGFIAGGVLAGAGAVLLLTAPHTTSATGASIAPYVGIGSVGAVGSF